MEHYNLRKYRGPETWALVREAYLKGEPGPALAKRFDVGLANLRKKARREGWTRRRHALATDAAGVRRMAAREAEFGEAPPTPWAALEAAVRLAGEALASGRSTEAGAILRAAESMARLVALTAPLEPPPPTPSPEERAAAREAEAEARRIARAEREAEIWRAAERLAHQMLSDRAEGCGAVWSREVYRFRARHFGEAMAAADYARGVDGGWAPQVWDEHGRVLPPEPPITPADYMVAQHERHWAWKRKQGEGDG